MERERERPVDLDAERDLLRESIDRDRERDFDSRFFKFVPLSRSLPFLVFDRERELELSLDESESESDEELLPDELIKESVEW